MPLRPDGAALRRALRVAVLPASLLATAAVVAGSSYSVFSSTAPSPGNSFTTGSVVLTNDSNSATGAQSSTGKALFSVTGMTPTSAPYVRCVTVQSSGSLASAVRLYASGAANTPSANALSDYVNVTIEMGTATDSNGGVCNGFTATSTLFSTGSLTSFTSSRTGYGTGIPCWTPTGSAPESRVFRVTVTPNSTTMTNAQQNSSTVLDFVWEADNT